MGSRKLRLMQITEIDNSNDATHKLGVTSFFSSKINKSPPEYVEYIGKITTFTINKAKHKPHITWNKKY